MVEFKISIFMKKSVSVIRPVSQKAYARFVERITIIVTDTDKRRAMLAALDAYLSGNRDTYARGLSPDCVPAFEMLRFEIDLAIARSAKARMRAGKNRVAEEKQPSAQLCDIAPTEQHEKSPAEDDRADYEIAEEAEGGFIAPITRRQRRAFMRGLSVKSRWRKISG